MRAFCNATVCAAAAVSDHQHLVNDKFAAIFRIKLLDFEFFTNLDTVLLATGFYNRIHN